MPHYPCYSSSDFSGKSDRGSYGDAVQEIDWGIGQIINTLQDLGIDQHTLVIFTSDNGPWKEAGAVDFLNMGGDGTTGSALPLAGWKNETLEGGMRVPTVIRWPGHVPAGSVCNELASTMDLLPTFAEIAGTDIHGDRVIDGKNILNLLTNPTGDSPHEFFLYYSSKKEKLNAIRDSQGYKLHLWKEPPGYFGKA